MMGNFSMIVVCSYCRKQIEEKEPYEDKRRSHGICPVCYDYYVPKLLGSNLSQHLDKQDSPAIIVDEEGRVIGINQAMLSFLGKHRDGVLGLLGGELMGCRYSRLDESCGKTRHCASCTIRNTMNRSRTSETDLENVSVYLDSDEIRLYFRISAFHRERFTKLVVHEILKTEPLNTND
jgi:PAS domain-containing protein